MTHLKEGDRVAAFVHGGLWEGEGSFAEYVKAEASLVWKVPENVGFEEAAASGGIAPCAFRFPFSSPSLPSSSPYPDPLFLQGPPFRPCTSASSSTRRTSRPTLASPSSFGAVRPLSVSVRFLPFLPCCPFLQLTSFPFSTSDAIQLLKLSGYTVIATSSEKNFALLKEFGASDVYSCAFRPLFPFFLLRTFAVLSLTSLPTSRRLRPRNPLQDRRRSPHPLQGARHHL